jgi:hypothetical protein
MSDQWEHPSPVPRPFRPAHRGNQHVRFSPLPRANLHLFSTLEADASLLFEFDSTIEAICAQPDLHVYAWIDGVYFESRPDFWLRLRDGTIVIVEVKYDADLRDPASRAHRQIRVQKAWCDANGYVHLVLTYSVIWRNPTLLNSLRVLMAVFTADFSKKISQARDFKESVLELVALKPGIRICDVERILGQGTKDQLVRLQVHDLIRLHVIKAGIDEVVLSPDSRLFPGREFSQ